MAIAFGRKGGLRGGPARAKSLSPERLSEIGRMGAEARWGGKKKKRPHGALRPRGALRDQLIEEARVLFGRGWTTRELVDHFHVHPNTIRRWVNPEYDQLVAATARARKEKYQGECIICGTPTSGSYGTNRQTLCKKHKLKVKPKKDGIWPRERLIKAMQDWETIFGEPPSIVDWNSTQARKLGDEVRAKYFDDNKDQWPWFSQVVREFGTWNAGIKAAGFTPRPRHGTSESNSVNRKRKSVSLKTGEREKYWTRERILQRIQDYFQMYGVPPKSTEWLQPCEIVDGHRIWPTTGSVQKEFGSWNKGIREAGFTPYLIKKAEKRKKKRSDRVWTKEDIIKIIDDWVAVHRIPPTKTEWVTIPNRPGVTTTINMFGGTWGSVIEAAGYRSRPTGVTAENVKKMLPLPFGRRS